MRQRLLRWLRVSYQPSPPPGAGESLVVFRSARRYLHYLGFLFAWKQTAALFGLLFSLAALGTLDLPIPGIESMRQDWIETIDIPLGRRTVPLMRVAWVLEAGAVLGFLAQLVGGLIFLPLSWELRWYMVSDETLRLREGLVFLREQTMTVANIQNLKIRQGPLQKLFGIADLEVHTAGGGAASTDDSDSDDKSPHVGRFRGLDDARGLRDRLRRSLRQYRDAGLGNPDDLRPATSPGEDVTPLVQAAQSLRDEARRLRQQLHPPGRQVS